MTFWFRNQNDIDTYTLKINDGTDDLITLGVDDGVAEVFYDIDEGDWTVR
jgi:hypothetical protein